jgi:hypothetical protein
MIKERRHDQNDKKISQSDKSVQTLDLRTTDPSTENSGSAVDEKQRESID